MRAPLYCIEGLRYVDQLRATSTSGRIVISEFSQRLRFNFVWVASSSWLRLSAGRTAHALPPWGPDVAMHLAAIIRVPPRVASSVRPALDTLHQHSPHHHYYPPETMHVTVRKLRRFPSDDSDVAARLGELCRVLGTLLCGDLISPLPPSLRRYFRTTGLFTRFAGNSQGWQTIAFPSRAANGSSTSRSATWRTRTWFGSPVGLRRSLLERSLTFVGFTSGGGRYRR
jgi:hypothetical protein